MAALEIEEGVPVPDRAYRPVGELSTKLRALQPGQSLLVPASGRAGLHAVSKRAWHIIGAGKYRCSKIDEAHVRVWRLQ